MRGLVALPGELKRDAKLLMAMATIGSLIGGVLGCILQLYLKSIGFDARIIGLLSMVNIVSMAVFSIPFGVLGDRYGRRNMMIVGGAAFDFSFILLIATRSLPLLSLSFLLLGLGNASFNVLLFPLYASYFDEGKLEEAFGLMNFMSLTASSLGSLLGLIPPTLTKLRGLTLSYAYWILLTTSALLLVPVSIALILVRPDEPVGGSKMRLRSRNVILRFAMMSAILGLGAGLFINLIPYYLSVKFKVESDAVGVVLFATNVASAFANLFAAHLSQSLGVFRGILATLGLVAPLYLGVILSPLFPLAAALYVIRTSLMSVYATLILALLMRMTEDEERATANSVTSLIDSLLRGVGSAIGGGLMALNLDLPGLISVTLYASAIPAFYLLFREQG